MAEDAGRKDTIYCSVRRGPIAVASDYNDGKEHEGEAVWCLNVSHIKAYLVGHSVCLQSMEHRPPTIPMVLL